MISPEKNDDIPTRVIKSVVVPASNDRLVSIGDCITGLWILLSRVTNTLELRFFEVNEWVVPTPTALISRTDGTGWRASVAVPQTLNLFSAILTAYTVDGSLFVNPNPTTVVAAIPILIVVPAPVGVYVISSPVWKKWLSTINVLFVTSTTDTSDASNVLWNIGSPVCVKLNENLISLSVPVYDPSWAFSLESVNVTNPTPPVPVSVKLYWNTLVVTAVFAGGVKRSSISPPDVDEYPIPIVPIPALLLEKLSKYPNSVK